MKALLKLLIGATKVLYDVKNDTLYVTYLINNQEIPFIGIEYKKTSETTWTKVNCFISSDLARFTNLKSFEYGSFRGSIDDLEPETTYAVRFIVRTISNKTLTTRTKASTFTTTKEGNKPYYIDEPNCKYTISDTLRSNIEYSNNIIEAIGGYSENIRIITAPSSDKPGAGAYADGNTINMLLSSTLKLLWHETRHVLDIDENLLNYGGRGSMVGIYNIGNVLKEEVLKVFRSLINIPNANITVIGSHSDCNEGDTLYDAFILRALMYHKFLSLNNPITIVTIDITEQDTYTTKTIDSSYWKLEPTFYIYDRDSLKYLLHTNLTLEFKNTLINYDYLSFLYNNKDYIGLGTVVKQINNGNGSFYGVIDEFGCPDKVDSDTYSLSISNNEKTINLSMSNTTTNLVFPIDGNLTVTMTKSKYDTPITKVLNFTTEASPLRGTINYESSSGGYYFKLTTDRVLDKDITLKYKTTYNNELTYVYFTLKKGETTAIGKLQNGVIFNTNNKVNLEYVIDGYDYYINSDNLNYLSYFIWLEQNY